MAKTEEITFEVLVLIGSRWEAQGVYKANEHNVAIADAKSLEKVSTIKAVKVVKEYYDDQAKSSRSQTVYESKIKGEPERKPAPPKVPKVKVKAHAQSQSQSSAKSASDKASPSKANGSGGSPSDEMISAATNDGPKRPSLLSALLQMILSLVAAAITALMVTQLVTMMMRNVPSLGFISRDDFLILVFILVFAITALALITRILTKLKRLAPSLPSLSLGGSKTPSALKPQPKPKLYMSKPHALAVEEASTQPEPAPEAKAEEKAEEKAQQVEEPRPDDLLSEVITMNAFTADIVDVIKGEENKRDAHTVFGVVLFLVGAVQALRAQKKLTDHTYHQVAFQTLGSLGLSQERAQHFIEHTDEYLVSNARYSQMFQSGRNAMSANLESGVGPRGALVDALDDWDRPKSKIENQQPVTVLFTDIAGSTAMTQKLGDAGAQQVVHAHNVIVRDAILTFAGKEIKHTGDGIMASFPNAVAGVEAARDMQRHTKAHNLAHPELPLGLKIGLNAGDPIAEDDDLFGTTVQLAARIVDKAKAGQILVSGSVHGLSQGKNLRFERFGDLEMKGFDESMTVYLAPWEDTPTEPVVQPAPNVAPALHAQPAPAAAPAAPAAAPVTKPNGSAQG
ncbi:MAG: adenylate/guanylate cyclase domain-containing protein [Rhodospirillales bacterium]|nr:adenylate/guanylate cyclase domain-containing protein [Rhodospirillales bacterium]